MFGDNFVILIWSKMLNVIFVESFAFQTPLKLYKNMFGKSLVLPNTTTMAKYFLAKGLSFQRQIKMTNIIGRELSLQPPLQWSNLVRWVFLPNTTPIVKLVLTKVFLPKNTNIYKTFLARVGMLNFSEQKHIHKQHLLKLCLQMVWHPTFSGQPWNNDWFLLVFFVISIAKERKHFPRLPVSANQTTHLKHGIAR